MLGMIAAVTLLASVDDQLVLPEAPLGVPEQHWSGRAAGVGALGLVGADLVTVVAGAALIGVTSKCSNQETLCINEAAALVAVVGLVVLPPTLALLLASNGTWDGRAVSLAVLAQGAAIACFAGASGYSSNLNSTVAMALFASGLAFHFVGIPLAAGLVTTRPSREEASAGVAPTLGLALRW